MVNSSRILKEFEKMVSFDSESFAEYDIKEYLKDKLIGLGLRVIEDEAASKLGHENPKSAGNLYGFLKGNTDGEPILFSSHMDTVSPGKGKKAVLHEDGRITSDGSTVLGADDISGLVSILEALTVIVEEGLPHPDLEVVFSVAEEPFCKGISVLDFRMLKSKTAYVLDLTGRVGTAAVKAPTILTLDIWTKGRAAHSGFSPEEGINALTIAANALSRIRTGRISPDTTVNFGMIEGGTGKNIVPASVHIQGEIRSLVHEEALSEADRIHEIFREEAESIGGKVGFETTEVLHSYDVAEDEAVRRRFEKAVSQLHREKPTYVTTLGGSDGNYFNKNGIRSIVVSNAMQDAHTVFESTQLSELIKSAELTLKLMTLREG
ncbi:MAG: M20/M25/M40 family metallo-hydrolase [Eubacteriales bacterium]